MQRVRQILFVLKLNLTTNEIIYNRRRKLIVQVTLCQRIPVSGKVYSTGQHLVFCKAHRCHHKRYNEDYLTYSRCGICIMSTVTDFTLS